MIRFKEFIAEARSHPDSNPKISAYEYLKKYKNDPTIYIGFTDDLVNHQRSNLKQKNRGQTKIGINPRSNYNTPLGIYCYPLVEAWEKYEVDRTKSLRGLPFAADRPFMWVLKAKDSDGFVNDMYSNYTSNNYDADYRTLRNIFMKRAKEFEAGNRFMDMHGLLQRLFTINEYPSNEIYRDFRDNFKSKFFISENYEYIINPKLIDKFVSECWMVLVAVCLETRKEENPIMAFWQMSRFVAMFVATASYGNVVSSKWNWVLRTCGYTGFADKSGRGYIHPSEPMQAFFLSKDAFTVIDKLNNKDYLTKAVRSLDEINELLFRDKSDMSRILNFLRTGLVPPSHNSTLTFIGDHRSILRNASKTDFKTFLQEVWRYVDSDNDGKGYPFSRKWAFQSCGVIFDLMEQYHDYGVEEVDQIKSILSKIDPVFP